MRDLKGDADNHETWEKQEIKNEFVHYRFVILLILVSYESYLVYLSVCCVVKFFSQETYVEHSRGRLWEPKDWATDWCGGKLFTFGEHQQCHNR